MSVPVAEQQRSVHGGMKVGAAFLGFVTAVGMTTVLGGLVGAVALVLGLAGAVDDTFIGPTEVGIGGPVAVGVVLFLAWLAGGYVAGRMARFDGARQGFAVWAWTVLVAVVLVVLALPTGVSPLESVLAPAPSEIAVALVVLVVAPALITLLAAVLGGRLGMRFHRRVDRTGLDPAPDPPPGR